MGSINHDEKQSHSIFRQHLQTDYREIYYIITLKYLHNFRRAQTKTGKIERVFSINKYKAVDNIALF